MYSVTGLKIRQSIHCVGAENEAACTVRMTIEGLQNSLDKMYDYCQKWKLHVNLVKTRILIGNQSGPESQREFWFWGDRLMEKCRSYKYLGIVFTTSGISKNSLLNLYEQANSALLAMRYRLKKIGKPPIHL